MSATTKRESLLQAFLLSQSTVLCLGIRIALLLDHVPHDVQQWLSHPALRSLFSRPCRKYIDMETLLVEIEQAQQSGWRIMLLLPWLLLVADLLTAYVLIHLGTTLRKQQDQDEEEHTLAQMPDAIRPKYKVFAQTETDDDDGVYLMPRKHLPHLSGSIYLWGTLLASSSTIVPPNHVYSGVLSSVVNALCAPWMSGSSSGDALVPIFLIPLYLSLSRTKRFEHQKHPLMAVFVLIAVWYYYIILSPTIFEIPTYSTPNLGVQWYLSQQVFDRFRPYFGIMFFGIRFALIIPLAIQFGPGSMPSCYPMELATCYWFVYTIFQMHHPTVTDFLICLSLMLQSPRSLARMGAIPSLVALCAIPVPLILYCLDWQLWLETGTGNANFIYFQCLAYHAFIAILFIEFCGATVRRQTALQLTRSIIMRDEADASSKVGDGGDDGTDE